MLSFTSTTASELVETALSPSTSTSSVIAPQSLQPRGGWTISLSSIEKSVRLLEQVNLHEATPHAAIVVNSTKHSHELVKSFSAQLTNVRIVSTSELDGFKENATSHAAQ